MQHSKSYRKLSRQRSHYRALIRNLAQALFLHERITTTVARAKEMRTFVDKMIGLGKAGTLHDRRRAFALLGNKTYLDENGERQDILEKVFGDFAQRYKKRAGGYTRIIPFGNRPGDAAPVVIIELVDANLNRKKETTDTEETAAETSEKTEKKKKKLPAKKKTAKAADKAA